MSGEKQALDLIETEIAIKYIKDRFERELAAGLGLTRVSAPLFVFPETGLNDNLNGYERTVSFGIKALGREVEVVQSLAKWKRSALARYGFKVGEGLYTDMNAIRRDEDLDALHSVYVDQWDWEKIIAPDERNIKFLHDTVEKIFAAIRKTAEAVEQKYCGIKSCLPQKIAFVTALELEEEYPHLTRKERENAICKKYGAVFVEGIGGKLKDGEPHDGRAADYDDWTMNGDILVYNEMTGGAFELSSMGIRVNADSLKNQLSIKGESEKLNNPYCRGVISGELPLTIGGGIGQSRLCMYLLKKRHIGEVQSSVWDEKEAARLAADGVILL